MESPNTVGKCGIFTPTKISSNPPRLAYQHRELPHRKAQNGTANELEDQYTSIFLPGNLKPDPMPVSVSVRWHMPGERGASLLPSVIITVFLLIRDQITQHVSVQVDLVKYLQLDSVVQKPWWYKCVLCCFHWLMNKETALDFWYGRT